MELPKVTGELSCRHLYDVPMKDKYQVPLVPPTLGYSSCSLLGEIKTLSVSCH